MTTRSRDSPRVAWRPGVETRLHAREAAELCVIEQWSVPGAGAPTHTHFEVEEVIAVLGGAADFWVDGVTARVEHGDTILLPAQSWHGFRNVGNAELHTLAVFSAARPRVAYEDDPETVLEIGGTRNPFDAHRSYYEDEGAT
ncbi:MAG: cupin domain-containing protein [Gaiellaceae bacterium]